MMSESKPTAPGAWTEEQIGRAASAHARKMAEFMGGPQDLSSYRMAAMRAALSALNAAPGAVGAVGAGWKPIESAPKDGTWFVALQDGETYPCQWHTEEPDEGPYHEGWWDHFHRSFEEPTHWSPAPALAQPSALPRGGRDDGEG